jgi:predicted nucleic acid-binding protein
VANSPNRFYWDACAWIAFIQKETVEPPGGQAEDRESMCRSVLIAAKAGKVESATSTLSLVEVCKDPASASEAASRFHEFLELEYVLLVTLDRAIGEKARELMQGGYSGLKPLGATHLATAIVANAHEMHTFDRKLLDLDGLLAKAGGLNLKICKPDPGGSLPLFQR